MTLRATLLHDSLARVLILEIRLVVIRRLQSRPLWVMALGAAERRFDLVVAHQAIGHPRHIGVADMVRRVDSAMARQTRVRRAKLGTNRSPIRYVGLLLDRRSDCRRNISQRQMLRVAEVSERSRPWRTDRPAVVTRFAHRGIRQQVVRYRRAGRNRGMAIRALLLQLQMQFMGEGRLLGVCPRSRERAQKG
jgi:hypothetical protein